MLETDKQMRHWSFQESCKACRYLNKNRGKAIMALDGKTLGLALSGGGYRATLFGLGSLWRLNEAGLLGKLDRITSVSGGSILMGILAHRWQQLRFNNGRADNFEEVIAKPIRTFCGKTIDVGAGLI